MCKNLCRFCTGLAGVTRNSAPGRRPPPWLPLEPKRRLDAFAHKIEDFVCKSKPLVRSRTNCRNGVPVTFEGGSFSEAKVWSSGNLALVSILTGVGGTRPPSVPLLTSLYGTTVLSDWQYSYSRADL